MNKNIGMFTANRMDNGDLVTGYYFERSVVHGKRAYILVNNPDAEMDEPSDVEYWIDRRTLLQERPQFQLIGQNEFIEHLKLHGYSDLGGVDGHLLLCTAKNKHGQRKYAEFDPSTNELALCYKRFAQHYDVVFDGTLETLEDFDLIDNLTTTI